MCLVPSLHAWRVWYSALFLGGRMKRGPKQKKTIENRSGEERSTQFRGLEMNLACQPLTKGDGLGVKSSESTLAKQDTPEASYKSSSSENEHVQWHQNLDITRSISALRVNSDGSQNRFSPLATTLREPEQMIGTSVGTCPDLGWNGKKSNRRCFDESLIAFITTQISKQKWVKR